MASNCWFLVSFISINETLFWLLHEIVNMLLAVSLSPVWKHMLVSASYCCRHIIFNYLRYYSSHVSCCAACLFECAVHADEFPWLELKINKKGTFAALSGNVDLAAVQIGCNAFCVYLQLVLLGLLFRDCRYVYRNSARAWPWPWPKAVCMLLSVIGQNHREQDLLDWQIPPHNLWLSSASSCITTTFLTEWKQILL